MEFPVFDEIRAQLVSEEIPARDEGDMDFERCAALHNAIVKLGWTASGRSLDALPRTTCWEANQTGWEGDVGRLQPSLIAFLQRAYDTDLPKTQPVYNLGCSREYRFFYFLEGLIGPRGYEAFDLGDHIGDFPGHYMTLYTPNDRLGSHAQGLIYNQTTHECVVNFMNTDFNPLYKTLPWQRLETTLSVYIDMIESGKIVCIHNDVEKPGDWKFMDSGGEQQWRSTQDRPDALLSDPNSGLQRNDDVMFGPWIVQPYTKELLEQCLQTWELLVEAIEQKMPVTQGNVMEAQYGLADEQMLETAGITEDFPKQLLSHARRPRFAFIAPGIRLPTPEEFIDQPFRSLRSEEDDADTQKKMPTLLFVGDDTCQASNYFPYPYSDAPDIPTGLYLEGWTQNDLTPFTDAARLLLPFSIGGEDTWAQTSNGLAIENSHDQLYQIGDNPFGTNHGVSLLGILQNFYAHVHQENWSVGERGVSEPVEKYREAEMEESCGKYIVPMGPGEYW